MELDISEASLYNPADTQLKARFIFDFAIWFGSFNFSANFNILPANEYAESLVSMSFICDNYKQMFIEYPILVQKITTDYNFDKHNEQLNVGKYCITTIFEDGYENIPYLGLYLGEQPLSILSAYESESATIRNKFITNPAIYIFSFKKIFFGVNTKWKFIENIEDLKLVEDEKLSCGFFENVKKTL